MQPIDATLAQQLLANGAILIVAGCPAGTEFGIDLNAYKVDERFRGVKMIPPGVHYVYTASCQQQGTHGDTALRTGFIHFFQPQEVVIREWDAAKEELRKRTGGDPAVETKRIHDNLKELDSFLAPFDFESLPDWNYLTQHITASRVNSTMPECGLVRTSAEYESCPDAARPKGTDPNASAAVRFLNNKLLQNEELLLPNLQVIAGTAIRFTTLPDRCPAAANPTEITQAYMDCIAAVDQLVSLYQSPESLIDECQIAFVFFHSGCSVDALAHWRKILNLLANSETAVERYTDLYSVYLSVIEHQLPLLPDEMMSPGEYNTVYKDVQQLVRNCSALPALRTNADLLTASVRNTMSWVFEMDADEDPDDLPVVVEM